MVALALVQGLVVLAWPVWPVIAVGLWWNSNTVSHNFIHRPIFEKRWCNRLFSAYLSVLLGIPQSLWRDLHLAHHSGVPWRRRVTAQIAAEMALVFSLWLALAASSKHFFVSVYVAGYAMGLALCALQGHYEHARGVISHYGAVYNFLCFNDGYHAEHHAYPGIGWADLPARRIKSARSSNWPAPLRWVEGFGLEGLERLALRSASLQRFVLVRHRRALAELLPKEAARVAIVGGGLFPRSAILLRELLPNAQIAVIEADAAHIAIAQGLVESVDFVHRRYAGERLDCDVAVIPLSLAGRERLYNSPPAPVTLIHEWIWRRRGQGRVVSWLLLKRVNRA